jgi:hypothetical protein
MNLSTMSALGTVAVCVMVVAWPGMQRADANAERQDAANHVAREPHAAHVSFQVVNPKTLAAGPIECERIALGEDDDYLEK